MSIQFDRPGAADQLDLTRVLDSLLIFKPKAEVTAQTAYGEKQAIEADVWVVDGTEAGAVYRNSWIFPLVLSAQLRRSVGNGKFVVGRLIKKPPTRPGTNAAWALADPTAADLEAASKFADANGLGDEPAPKVEAKSADLWGAPANAAGTPPF